MRTYVFILAVCISHALFAGHIRGTNITWDCLGADQYAVTALLFRDCSGAAMLPQIDISFNSPCGNFIRSFPLDSVAQVSQLCTDSLSMSTCDGGLLPGIEAYYYTDTVNLSPCDSWRISLSDCCRNIAVNTVGTFGTYVESTLNNQQAPCADSPKLIAPSMPFTCVNQSVRLPIGIVGSNNNVLKYTLIDAQFASPIPTPIFYTSGFSGSQPIMGIVLDSLSGVLEFTATTQGTYVIAMLVEEFDSQGDLIGTIIHDFQVVVLACGNSLPLTSDGTITNFSGTGSQTGPYAIGLCPTQDFCFDFSISDADLNDSLTLTSDAATTLPGSSLTLTGTNPITGTLCWTAPAGASGDHVVTFNIKDNSCPIIGSQGYAYHISIRGASVGPDQTICGTQTAVLGPPQGSSAITWSVLNGDPIVIGQNFSCNPCLNPVASPSITTTYIADQTLPCMGTDTMTIHVVPDFVNTVSLTDSSICVGEEVQITSTTAPLGNYDYSWFPSFGIADPTVGSPLALWSVTDTFEYALSVASAAGCVKTDSLQVVVSPSFSLAITPSSPGTCVGEPLDLDASPSPPGNYAFAWSPAAGLNDPNTSSPIVLWNAPGTYSYLVDVDNGLGCDRTVPISVQVDELPNPGVVVSDTLFSVTNPNSSYTYQWLDCTNGMAPIPGATDSTFLASGWASVALLTVNGACSDTSACFQTVGLQETEDFVDLTIYPNPSDGDFTASFGNTLAETTLTIFDLEGRLHYGDNLIPSSSQQISLDLAPGMYLINFRSNGQEITKRLVITNDIKQY